MVDFQQPFWVGDDQGRLIEKGRELLNACGLRNVGFRVLLDDGTVKNV